MKFDNIYIQILIDIYQNNSDDIIVRDEYNFKYPIFSDREEIEILKKIKS